MKIFYKILNFYFLNFNIFEIYLQAGKILYYSNVELMFAIIFLGGGCLFFLHDFFLIVYAQRYLKNAKEKLIKISRKFYISFFQPVPN